MEYAEADLLRLNRVLRHRLRNIASGIKSAVTFLEQELGDRLREEELEYFPLILKECDSLSHLTERFNLLLEEVPGGDRAPLAGIVAAAWAKVHPHVPAVTLEQQMDGAVGRDIVDGERHLRLALEELLMNAAEATPRGTIRLDAGRQSNRYRIAILNEVPGHQEVQLDAMFLPFYTTKTRHLGVGLPIARRLARLRGGEVDASLVQPGRLRIDLTFAAAGL